MVRVTQSFKFSSDGIRVDELQVGQEVTGRAAEVALAEGWGETVVSAAAAVEAAAEFVPTEVPPAPPVEDFDLQAGGPAMTLAEVQAIVDRAPEPAPKPRRRRK